MPRGGKRVGAGRKAPAGRKTVGGRVALLVRIDKATEEKLEMERVRSGGSLSNTVERLLKIALSDPLIDQDEAATKALGFIVGQAANAGNWNDRTWQNDPTTTQALKMALPIIIDYLAEFETRKHSDPHPFFKSPEEHARMICVWIWKRLKERGDEYGTDWPRNHPLRNFPKAALALNIDKIKGGNDGERS
jgi:hypothetical protein